MLSVASSFCTFTPLTHQQIAMGPTPTSKIKRPEIMQNLIQHPNYYHLRISQLVVEETAIKENTLNIFSTDRKSGGERTDPLGISVGYTDEGKLAALAIADEERCCIIEFNSRSPPSTRPEKMQLLQEHVLCRSVGEIYAFDAAQLAMVLWTELGVKVARMVDIQSAFSNFDYASDRNPLLAIQACLGESGNVKLNEKNINRAFNNLTYNRDEINRMRVDILERAWISRLLPSHENGISTFSTVKPIDTSGLDGQFLDTLNTLARVSEDSRRVGYLKPVTTNHQFSDAQGSFLDPNGRSINARSSVYKDKFRESQDVITTFRTESGEQFRRRGQVAFAKGRDATLTFDGSVKNKIVDSITSKGRDAPTTAEAKRDGVIRRTLQGDLTVFRDNPWISNILLHHDSIDSDTDHDLEWPKDWFPPSRPNGQMLTIMPPPDSGNPARQHLNDSQQLALDHMLSSDPITLIQGPPGKSGIWLIAQSNVAVKNIAEKLIKTNFKDWKLLVSEDFRYDWHADLYLLIQSHVIPSTEFVSKELDLQGTKVFLCTLSMLSSRIARFTRVVPLRCMVVDEASQIKVAEYINVFTRFSTLRKICFIGDDKQLPPFGAESIEDLKSIFEIDHLHVKAFLLNIQYRMPPQLGDFISQAVYDSKLKSNPLHPIKDDIIACHFVDVIGHERQSISKSFINDAEAAVAVQLASHLQDKDMDYKIITPYDGQRNKILNDIKNTDGLNWEDKCFNVDSFQGNEEDYIVISLVRSRSIGFLKNLRRTNVMLTRCKKGMYILTSHSFMDGVGGESLAGELAEHVGKEAWLTVDDVKQGRI
ncbi:P-loop containing nucleoside triphosphate hydrolase protein [Armillaria fumosa]|nr:P-loop containing nucleoside triphosphate hydrolase protein [Armillaria fumosa]